MEQFLLGKRRRRRRAAPSPASSPRQLGAPQSPGVAGRCLAGSERHVFEVIRAQSS